MVVIRLGVLGQTVQQGVTKVPHELVRVTIRPLVTEGKIVAIWEGRHCQKHAVSIVSVAICSVSVVCGSGNILLVLFLWYVDVVIRSKYCFCDMQTCQCAVSIIFVYVDVAICRKYCFCAEIYTIIIKHLQKNI